MDPDQAGPQLSPKAPGGRRQSFVMTGRSNVLELATSTQNGSVSNGVPRSADSITLRLRWIVTPNSRSSVATCANWCGAILRIVAH